MTLAATTIDVVAGVFGVLSFGAQMLRWLRVLQREHYEPGSVVRFYWRWALPAATGATKTWRGGRVVAWPLVAVPVAGVLVGLHYDVEAAAVMALMGIFFPLGLAIRGRSSALVWTRRLRTVAAIAVGLTALVGLSALVTSRPWIVAAGVLLAVPLLVDLAARVARPIEDRVARKFVRQAQRRLAQVQPHIVAITGSFGKTSTKHHLAELLGGRHGVVPSPHSYNNRAGLSRAINENLADSTTFFIAEMGTYGPGEIADLCSWCPPEVAIVTAIGPVHLERMGTLDVIESAKFEITERAATVVLNGDDHQLLRWIPLLAASNKVVRTGGSTNDTVNVRVVTVAERWQVSVDGTVVAIAPPVMGVRESNLACAIAAALAVGLSIDEIIGRFAHLTAVSNRMVVATAPSGVMVIDDTFNANPVGARSALDTLVMLPISGRRVVVTPGMVELGREQFGANEQFARSIRAANADLVIVGRTNARALSSGFGADARRFANRDEAVEWVRATLRAGDGVLYLNDLPDHYP